MGNTFNPSKVFSLVSGERRHTSPQAPKGRIDGACGEVCLRSAPTQNTCSKPAWCGESVTHVCAQSVTYVYAPCREGGPIFCLLTGSPIIG